MFFMSQKKKHPNKENIGQESKKHPNKENIGKIIEVLWAGFFGVVVLFIFPVITLEFLLGIVMEIYLAQLRKNIPVRVLPEKSKKYKRHINGELVILKKLLRLEKF